MIKLKQAVVVEGKYDKIKLSKVVDAPIIVTNGFSIFKDKEKLAYIKKVADIKGIIILTDSDNAGMMIRKRIIQAVNDESEIINVYIPDVFGKEKRKRKRSSEGKLGVEGIDVEILRNAFLRFGVNCDEAETKREEIKKIHFYEFGLIGQDNSKEKRKLLAKELELPEALSANALLEAVNILTDYNEFKALCERII